ncbi:MAG: branched-chain amino acid ABC transporter permease [Haloferacaceae archaeon]
MSDDTEPDGGPVVDDATERVSGPADGLLERILARDDLVVVGFALSLVVFPYLLVNLLTQVGEAIGLSIGGYVGLPTLVLVFGIVVIGFNLLLGYTGLLSFGHAAFFGVSAYAAGIFTAEATAFLPEVVAHSPLVMIGVGTLVALAISWPIGFVSIRRSGVYFAVITLTFGQMLYYYALGPGAWLTNGDNGFSSVEVGHLLGTFALEDTVLGMDFLRAYTWQYLFVAVAAIFALWMANRITQSPYGLIFEALGQNEQRVSFVGLDVFRYKHMAFIISAGFAGAGGALFAIHETYIHPTTALYWITSGDFVIMTILGGTGSLAGPVIGALIFEYVSNVISGVSLPFIGAIGSLWRFVLGTVFVFIVWVFPKGVYGGVRDVVVALTGRGDDGGEEA